MKKLLVFIGAMFCGVAYADTETINWYVDDSTYATTTCQTGGDITLPAAPTKYGYTFQGWRDYIALEYIESPGCAYIQTDYIPNQDTGIKTKVTFNSVANDEAIVFGSGQAYNSRAFELYLWDAKVGFNYNKTYSTNKTLKVGDTVVLDWNKNIINWSLNGAQQNQVNLSYTTFVSPYPARIFAITRPDTASGLSCGTGKIKMYYLQIYENDVLVHDFVPAISANNIAGLYDKVEQKFYPSAVEENFIAGPVLNQ